VYGEVAEIFAHHATWLRVSMDGWNDDSYREYRGCGDGEFSKIIDNMRSFKRLGGKCYLGVSYIVDQKNATHIFEFVKQMKDIGVDSVKIAPCVVSNNGEENNTYHRPIFDLAKEQSQRAVAELSETSFEVYDSYHALDDKFAKDYSWCPYLQILPIIGADQNIYSCQDKAYNLSNGLIGTINDKRFKDYWLSDKSKFYKINPSKVCNHHCVANHKNKLVFEYLDADGEHICFV
jgi:MoaA/NifB/PqqE/SkfB family radical SAM enzyme